MSGAGLPAREAALTALRAVLDKEMSLDAAWREAKLTTLDPRDAGFARLLVLTTLRRLGSIDAVLDKFLRKRPVGGNAVAVHIMRIAAAELLALDGAAHAAVDSAVRLTKKQKNLSKLSGMVNAVCRKVAGEGVIRGGNNLTDGPATEANLASTLDRVRAGGFAHEPGTHAEA